MNKSYFLAGVVAVVMMMECLVGCADKDTEQPTTNMGNPWVETDKSGVMEATSFEMNVPTDAENVVYSYLDIEPKMGQVTYDLAGNQWTYRMQKATELTDISGMYYEWDVQGEDQVSGCDAMWYAYSEPGENTDYIDDMWAVHVINWYDDSTQTVYSLSVSGNNVNGLDIKVFAEEL